MKSTTRFPETGELLRLPFQLADRLTVDGLASAAQLRLALVLVSLSSAGPWSIAKPLLEAMSGVVLDNATSILDPLLGAELVQPATKIKPERRARLFQDITYAPGTRHKTAGIISVTLSSPAMLLLHGAGRPVIVPADELRRYATMGGMMLRMRLGARLSKVKTAKSDTWRLRAEDLTEVFGAQSKRWLVSRTAGGEQKQYMSLRRAADGFFIPGMEEINGSSELMHVGMRALTLSEGERSRWKAIIIETKVLARVRMQDDPPPAEKPEPKMSDLNNLRKERLPAYTRKKVKS